MEGQHIRSKPSYLTGYTNFPEYPSDHSLPLMTPPPHPQCQRPVSLLLPGWGRLHAWLPEMLVGIGPGMALFAGIPEPLLLPLPLQVPRVQ